MKVKLTLTLEVDAKAWTEEYGTAPHDVRTDVLLYMTGHVENSYPAENGIVKVLR